MHNRKIILFIATSLDGMIARSDGGIDWLFSDQDYGYAAFYESVDVLIMGRKTFEQALSFGEYPYPGKQAMCCHAAACKPTAPMSRSRPTSPHSFDRFEEKTAHTSCASAGPTSRSSS
jgi:dihydrofolate reductase